MPAADRRWLLGLAFAAGAIAPHFLALANGLLFGLPQ